MLNVSVFTGKLIRKPELRKDRRGVPLVNFCVRGEMGDVIPCFALDNTAKSISEMPCRRLLDVDRTHRRKTRQRRTRRSFRPVMFRVVSWDNRYPDTCETVNATSGQPM